MVGSNKDEGTFFARQNATAEQFTTQVEAAFRDLGDAFLKLYPGQLGSRGGGLVARLVQRRSQLAYAHLGRGEAK